MTQTNLYMEDDNLRLYIDVQPLFLDELENSKNLAVASAARAAQSEEAARGWKNDIEDYKTGLELFYAQATDGIENLYNSSVSDIGNEKTSAISDLQSQKTNIQNSLNATYNNALNNIRTNGQAYVDMAHNYAEEAQHTVDNRVSKDHLNQSKGLETGSVSDDEEVLSDIKKYAHSTFDLSKFTVVGSPNITDDGIASGFSSSNYLLVNGTGINNTATSWKIAAAFTTNLTGSAQEIWCEKVSNLAQCYIRIDASNKLRIFLMADDSTTIINYVLGSTTLSDNTNYLVETIYVGTSYQVLLTNISTGVTTTEASVTSAKKIRDISTLSIGVSGLVTPGNPNAGSINLKQFSITVDGVEVFSGNKTGIDTIKPDNYTVVGSPTISADGIASGFSSSNYLALPSGIELGTNKSWQVVWQSVIPPVETGNIFTNSFTVGRNNTTGSMVALLYLYNPNTDSYSNLGISIGDLGSTNVGNKYKGIVEYDGIDKYSFTVTLEDGTVKTSSATSSSYYKFLDLHIGGSTLLNTFDLNAFKIYVDGNLVYQPCLKIPYTESSGKYGSKIVSAIYRDRVKDAYEQGYQQRYYTLDEENGNFTLPMGDIYGMIESLRQLINQMAS